MPKVPNDLRYLRQLEKVTKPFGDKISKVPKVPSRKLPGRALKVPLGT